MMDLTGYGRQQVDDDDIAAVAEALRGPMLTGGAHVAAFEKALQRACDAPHAIACANGTAALHLAAMALGLGPGDAVIVPTLTFLATANAARYVGAEVVFADVEPETGLLTPETLADAAERAESATGNPVRAVFPVHLNGLVADVPALSAMARGRGWKLVEDGCHALGSEYCTGDGFAAVGDARYSDAVCFSFHPVKTIAMGEGGAVTTRNPEIAERLARLRNHGMVRDAGQIAYPDQGLTDEGHLNPWYYEMPELGYNFRVSDINCALGVSQLKKLDRFVTRRRELASCYDRHLGPYRDLIDPVGFGLRNAYAWHLYVVRIDFGRAGTTRSAVMTALREQGIGTQVHYLPVHRQPYYRERYGDVSLRGADAYYESILTLPLFPQMQEEDVDRVVRTLVKTLGL